MPIRSTPKRVILRLQGWAGLTEQWVLLVGETPKRYRIRAIETTKLAGRRHWLAAGEEALVPHHAIWVPTGGA